MIVLVLVVIWFAALAPFVLRRLSEHQATASLTRFHQLTRMLGGRYGDSVHYEETVPYRGGSAPDDERRNYRARMRVRHQRRLHALAMLGGIGVFTLTLGALPALRFLWLLTMIDVVLAVTYIGLLAYFTRMEIAAAERRALRNIYPLPPRLGEAAAPARMYATVGMGGRVRPLPLRPAFRIVEAPN
jgi:hypothetical protein